MPKASDHARKDAQKPAEVEPVDAVGMSEVDLVAWVLECKKKFKKVYEEVHAQWEENWDAYQNELDYSDREDWQAKVVMPKIRSTVKKATSMVRHLLLASGDYLLWEPVQDSKEEQAISEFGNDAEHAKLTKLAVEHHHQEARFLPVTMEVVEGAFALGLWWGKLGFEPVMRVRTESVANPTIDEKGNPVMVLDEKAIDWAVIRKRLKQRDYDPKIIAAIDHAVEAGASLEPPLALIPDVTWEIEQVERSVARLAYSAVDPRNLFTDANHKSFVESSETTLDEIQDTLEADPGRYNPEQVKKLRDMDYGDASEVDEDRLRRVGLGNEKDSHRKTVHLDEYWGDLIDSDGKLVKRNCRVVVANELHVLNYPTAEDPDSMNNPYWHQKPPYLGMVPLPQVGRLEGTAIAEHSIKLWKAINDMVNLELDNLVMRLLRLPQVKVDWLENPEDAESLIPGRPIWLNEDATGPAVIDTPLADVPQSAKYLGEYLDRAYQNGTMITDALMGLMNQRGGTTLGEIEHNTAEGASYMETVARAVEEYIEEAGEMTRQLIIQYGFGPDADPVLLRKFERQFDDFSEMPAAQRVQFLQSDMDVKSTGISGYFRMADVMKRVIDLVTIASRWEPLGMIMDKYATAQRIFKASGLEDPEELLLDEDVAKQLQDAMLQKISGGNPPPGDVLAQFIQSLPEQWQPMLIEAMQRMMGQAQGGAAPPGQGTGAPPTNMPPPTTGQPVATGMMPGGVNA